MEGLKPVKAWWVSQFGWHLHWEPLCLNYFFRFCHLRQGLHWEPWLLSCLLACPQRVILLLMATASRQLVVLRQQCLQRTTLDYNWCTIMELFFYINSSWTNDPIWHQRSWAKLVQVMACCLMAPSRYLNQCWLLTNEVLWHSPEITFTMCAQSTILYKEFEQYTFINISTIPRGQMS